LIYCAQHSTIGHYWLKITSNKNEQYLIDLLVKTDILKPGYFSLPTEFYTSNVVFFICV